MGSWELQLELILNPYIFTLPHSSVGIYVFLKTTVKK